MKRFSPFFSPGNASPSYVNTRDAEPGSYGDDVRILMEEMWAQYWPYADDHFLSAVRWEFDQRTWEMYIAWVLMRHGYEINKVGNAGPEFFVMIDGVKTWIEAIAPHPGTGPDAVPALRSMNELVEAGEEPVQNVPEEQILLRLTHSILDKMRKHRRDIEQQRIDASDAYILAINGWRATGARGESVLPFILKATLGYGHYSVPINTSTMEWGSPYWTFRGQVKKQNDESVSTTPLLSSEYSGISGILYSPSDICNVHEPFGREMMFLHNPLAIRKLPTSCFKFCREYQCLVTDGSISVTMNEPTIK